MIIDRELFVQFKENTEDVKVKDILRKEGLIIKKKNNWLGQNYLVATSDNAKYIDALQMSNYIQDTYDNIYYSSPNWTKFGPPLEY